MRHIWNFAPKLEKSRYYVILKKYQIFEFFVPKIWIFIQKGLETIAKKSILINFCQNISSNWKFEFFLDLNFWPKKIQFFLQNWIKPKLASWNSVVFVLEVCEASSDYGSTMLRIFELRNPTNLTGRFPSTVALHAKVEELEDAAANVKTDNKINSRELQLPNIVQPLSLLPDWR